MLKSTVKLLPFLFLLLFAANSCKKKNDQKSKTQLITEKSWIVSNDEYRVGTNPNWTSEYVNYSACEKDDFLKFEANNTGVANAGALKCGAEPQTLPFNWSFTDSETKLSLQGESYKIEQLTESTLVISYEDNSVSPIEYYRLTFRH
ncbi:hypothetical protein WG954_17625 [Lacibacter sp. H375]|uniref:hypothetical protein n=1 Tax=Lacibacter sp. H375 TaxID=3133424 RepID=UPI0030C3F857